MWTIISGTNRKGANTLKIAKSYQQIARGLGVDIELISLEDLPLDLISVDMYHTPHSNLEAWMDQYVYPAEKFTFIVPEYNGSIPGIFKLWMDAVDIHRAFKFKKVSIVGVSNGRAGNLRGLDELTNIAHYLKMNVFYQKIPISVVKNLLDQNDQIADEATIKLVEQQIEQFKTY